MEGKSPWHLDESHPNGQGDHRHCQALATPWMAAPSLLAQNSWWTSPQISEVSPMPSCWISRWQVVRPFQMPFSALGFSARYTNIGFSLKSPAALAPRSRVSLSQKKATQMRKQMKQFKMAYSDEVTKPSSPYSVARRCYSSIHSQTSSHAKSEFKSKWQNNFLIYLSGIVRRNHEMT